MLLQVEITPMFFSGVLDIPDLPILFHFFLVADLAHTYVGACDTCIVTWCNM